MNETQILLDRIGASDKLHEQLHRTTLERIEGLAKQTSEFSRRLSALERFQASHMGAAGQRRRSSTSRFQVAIALIGALATGWVGSALEDRRQPIAPPPSKQEARTTVDPSPTTQDIPDGQA